MPIIDRAGVPLHYRLEGDAGPPVLLVHGCGVPGEGWRPQIDALARNHRVAVFDNRGIGKSGLSGPLTVAGMVEDARAVLDELEWPSAHVVGHSLGGIIVQQLALDSPERVRSLSLLCTFFRGRDGARLTMWMLWVSLRMYVGPRAWRRRAFLEMVMPRAYLESVDVEALAAEVGRFFERDIAAQPPIVMKQVRALGAHDASALLGALSAIPTLIVSAAEDRIAAPEQGRALGAAIQGSRYVEIAGAAHAVTIHMAEEINALLANHVETVERSSPRSLAS